MSHEWELVGFVVDVEGETVKFQLRGAGAKGGERVVWMGWFACVVEFAGYDMDGGMSVCLCV